MIEPGICAGLDGDETVSSMFIGQGSTCTREVRIKRGRMLFLDMPIPSGGIRLPNLDECVGDGSPIAVEHASTYDNALTNWLACMLAGQIVILFPYFFVPKNRSGNFRERVWPHDQWVQRRAFDGRAVRLVEGRRLTALGRPFIRLD